MSEYCGVCGEDDCKDVMSHIDDDDLMHEIMGFAINHPDGYCPKCGSSQTIYEADTEGYQCDDPDCNGILLHPQRVLGLV